MTGATSATRTAGTPAGGQKTLHLHDVHKHYGGRTVVDIADLVLGAHGIEGLIGPNGAGKTTLMKLITHVVSPDRGRIEYHSPGGTVVLTKHSPDAIARMGVVKTNQVIQDFESLTIRESLLLSLAGAEQEKFWKVRRDNGLPAPRERGDRRVPRPLPLPGPRRQGGIGRREEAPRHPPLPAAQAPVPPDGRADRRAAPGGDGQGHGSHARRRPGRRTCRS